MKEFLLEILIVYLIASMFIWAIRASGGDCELRYMDFVFPISKIHCPVGK
jgi:hypothetical protein